MIAIDKTRPHGAFPGIPELDMSALGEGGPMAATARMITPAKVAPRVEGSPAMASHVWQVLDTVLDPEVPAVSIRELGIVRDVRCDGEHVDVVLTPTYSGCPATEMIEAAVREALDEAGYVSVAVSHRRAPAWTTDWITDEGRRKLREYGIAPPSGAAAAGDKAGDNTGDNAEGRPGVQPLRFVSRRALAPVACPRCGSAHTERLSAFGSTACKALYRCRDCHEPFEYFKPI